MKPAACIHYSRSAYFLKKVINSGFQPEIFKGWGHQAVRYITDQLDRIIYDLLGIVDALQLRADILVYEILIKIKPGCSQQRPGIVVKVGRNSLALFFLPSDRGIQQYFLLFLFHLLELYLVADHPPLVKNDKNNQPYCKCQHTHSAKEQGT